MKATLHYIFDPLCGWCYGAEPLAQAAATVGGLDLALHAGGLWPEPTVLPDATRQYIAQADQRLAQISGQTLGEQYRTKLLFDPELVLDSQPTTKAVLAAQALTGAGLQMLRAIQHAHYVDGRHVVREDVLIDLAASLGIDKQSFVVAWNAADALAHIGETRRLMAKVGAQGFPTFVLELDGQLHGVEHNRFQRKPADFAAWLRAAVSQRTGTTH
jgi:putative protein-disulfide isomerase